MNASGNWWGDNTAADVKAAANAGTRADFTPWLNAETDIDGGARGIARTVAPRSRPVHALPLAEDLYGKGSFIESGVCHGERPGSP